MNRLEQTLNRLQEALTNLSSPTSDEFPVPRLTFENSTIGEIPEVLRLGNFVSNTDLSIPAYLPLTARKGIEFIVIDKSRFPQMNESLEKAVFLVLKDMGFQNVRLALIDGKNHGLNLGLLSGFRELVIGDKIHTAESEIKALFHTLISEQDEGNTLLVINNFPVGFSNESLAQLSRLTNNSSIFKGKVLLTKESKVSSNITDLDASISNNLVGFIFMSENEWRCDALSDIDGFGSFFRIDFSPLPDSELIKNEIGKFNLEKESTNVEDFSIDNGIKVPFGKEAGRTFYFRLGHGASNYHAIVAGRSGKGKTVFLDNLICRAAQIYGPDELRLVLLDLKGIEFNDYKKLPHVQAFCSSSKLEDGIKIIDYLKEELLSREALFNRFDARNIQDYKLKSGATLHRLLVIIDEFQNLFTGNYKSDGYVEDILIKQILRLGRAYGVHLICCTQSMGDGVKSSFLNNIPLRIAFQMASDQSRSFLALNNVAAESLKQGEVIYNEGDGLLIENRKVKVDYLQSSDIIGIVDKLRQDYESSAEFEKLIIAK